MKEIIYHKLVRDNIPKIIQNTNKEPIIRIATINETKTLLLDKLIEELTEFKQNPSVEELADMLEVIEGICEVYNYDMNEVLQAKSIKKASNGGFNKRIVLEKVIDYK